MGLFDRLFNKGVTLPPLHDVSDEDIVAMADGEMIDIRSVSDPMFAEEMLGRSLAFKYDRDKVIICSPANGRLEALFPTGHAFGVVMENGVNLIVHCGIDTVNANGDGFRLLGKKKGDSVRAGDPIVEVDIAKLSRSYDMSTMLIISDAAGKDISFIDRQNVERGQSLIRQ